MLADRAVVVSVKNQRHPRAFSLIELLVVVALIAVLIALVLYAVGALRKSARSTLDGSRQRQLIIANINYTGDYEGRWLNSMTNSDPDCWVKAYGANIGAGNRELVGALHDGSAWTYLGDEKAYKSPEDSSDRVRSYSYNAQVGVRPNGYHVTGGYGPATWTFSTIRMPGDTMMTVVEHSEYGYNPQGFYVGLPGTAYEGCWVDYPAYWNPKGVNIGYVDGSVRFYTFKDPDLPNIVDHAGTWGFTGPDLDYFEGTMMPGWDGNW